ncbi:MAG: hypothetical protein WA821_14115 [Anaerolineales bacterium]
MAMLNFKYFEKVSTTTTLPTGAASGCKGITYGVTYYDGLNNPTISFSQTVNWCYDGTKITSVTHTHGTKTYQGFYKYNGLLADNHSGGVGKTSFYAYSQANMCETVPGFGCNWYIYPSVTETVYGNGTFSASVTK